MGRYLVVAHQTASNPELIERLRMQAGIDPDAVFTLLVPVTFPGSAFVVDQQKAIEEARATAHEARNLYERYGLPVVRTEVSDASPILAIEDEMRVLPGFYDAIVLSTFPPGMSRWLHLDVHTLAERKFGLPIFHVISQPAKRPKVAL